MYGVAFITIVGELADDVRMRTIGDKQTKLATFRVKVAKPKRRPDDKYCPTSWLDCKAWAYVADMIEGGRKGDAVHVVGEMDQESWEKDGKKHYKLVCTASTIYTAKSSRLADRPPTATQPPPQRNVNALYEEAQSRGGDNIPY